MSACPKCNQEAGCPCGWPTASSGEKVCQACFARDQVQYNSQPQNVVAPIIPPQARIGIQPNKVTYTHNYT